VAEACAKLAESQRIDPRLGTLLNVAACHEQEGRTATAWSEFNEAASQAAIAKQAEREAFARGKVAEIEKKLSRLKVVLRSAPAGAEVKLDGSVLRTVALGTPLPLDPGAHTLEVTAPSHNGWTRSITMAAGPAEQTVEVPTLDPTAAPTSPSALAPAPAPAPASKRGASKWTAAGLGLFAVGSAAVGAGVFFGLRTFAKRDDAEKLCTNDGCTQAGIDTYDEARHAATFSTITLSVGVAMLAAGTYFVFFPPSGTRAQAAKLGPGTLVGQW